MNLIQAIGQLWKLGLVLFFIMFVLMFRKQLATFLGRMTKLEVRRGNAELSIQAEENAVDASTSGNIAVGQQAIVRETAATLEAVSIGRQENSTDGDELLDEFLKAGTETRDESLIDELYERLIKTEVDKVKLMNYRRLYLTFKFYLGDTTAVTSLQELAVEAINTITHPKVLYSLGLCYRSSSLHEKAIEIMTVALTECTDESFRVPLTVELSDTLFSIGKKEDAYALLIDEVAKPVDANLKFALFTALATLYKQASEYELQALALERALESKPNDTDVLFEVAYAYGQQGSNFMSLLHYLNLLNYKPDSWAARNNLGVAYSSLNMNIAANAEFAASMQLGNTLAASNLAERYLTAGFLEDARRIINEALSQSNVDSNVGRVLDDISKTDSNMDSKRQETLQTAGEQHAFFKKYAFEYFDSRPSPFHFAGTWRMSDHTEVHIENEGSQVVAEWQTGDKFRRFQGQLHNNAVRLSLFSGKTGENGKTQFRSDGKGYAYLTATGKELIIMRVDDGIHTQEVWTRL